MAKNQKNGSSKSKEVYLTSKGLDLVKDELEFLKRYKRAEIAQKIQQAREYGDLTENSEYDAAMDEQSMVENKIAELEGIIKESRVIEDNHTTDFVVIGSTLKIEMDEGVEEFTIVGRTEADPSKKRISNESPLGAALLGAKVGEEVEVTTPIVRYKCKILELR